MLKKLAGILKYLQELLQIRPVKVRQSHSVRLSLTFIISQQSRVSYSLVLVSRAKIPCLISLNRR